MELLKALLLEFNEETVLFHYRGKFVHSTFHSRERFQERLATSGIDFNIFFKNMIDKIIRLEEQNFPFPEEMMIYSRSINQAIIIAFHRKRQRYLKQRYELDMKNIYIVTMLPHGKSRPRPGTQKFIIENKIFTSNNIIEID